AARNTLRELRAPGRAGIPGADPGGHGPRRRSGGRLGLHRDGPLLPDGVLRHSPRPDAGGIHLARFRGRPDAAHYPRHPGHRGHLPPSRAAGEDRHHPRRPLRRAGDAGDRGSVVRARAPGPRRAVPAGWGEVREAGGDAGDLRADVGRRRRAVRGPPLPAGGDDLLPAPGPTASAEDPHRGHGRAQDPPARRAPRRRVQPVRLRSGGHKTQARSAGAPLRNRGPRPLRHREDHHHGLRPPRRRGRLRRWHGGVRPSWDREGLGGAARTGAGGVGREGHREGRPEAAGPV
ncbi:MAG: hypothetical protein AVDCRST_MAG03-3869, partial [uncultured Rubrobacteraceae bacterium]